MLGTNDVATEKIPAALRGPTTDQPDLPHRPAPPPSVISLSGLPLGPLLTSRAWRDDAVERRRSRRCRAASQEACCRVRVAAGPIERRTLRHPPAVVAACWQLIAAAAGAAPPLTSSGALHREVWARRNRGGGGLPQKPQAPPAWREPTAPAALGLPGCREEERRERLTTNDALSYLREVKTRFANNRKVYDR